MNSIIIIEDHPVMRKGLAAWFAGTGRWQVLGIAENLDAAKSLLPPLGRLPGVILLDIQLKGNENEENYGLDFIPWLKKRFGKKAPAVVVYTQFDDYVHAASALSYGVSGYVCKYRGEAELEAALLAVLRGELSIDPAVETKVEKADAVRKLLTPREAEILALVKHGLSNKRIADKLSISPRTVENILSCVYFKTGISSRVELQRM